MMMDGDMTYIDDWKYEDVKNKIRMCAAQEGVLSMNPKEVFAVSGLLTTDVNPGHCLVL